MGKGAMSGDKEEVHGLPPFDKLRVNGLNLIRWS